MIDKRTEINIERTAYLCVIMSAVLWGIIGIFVKKLNEYGFSSLQIVFIRAMVATISVAAFYSIKYKKIKVIELQDAKYFVGTGILSFVFFNWCLFTAMNETSLAVATILLYTAPTIVMVLSVFLFKEKMTKIKFVSLGLTFIGCVFVTFSGQSSGIQVSTLGVLAGLGAGLGYALYSIFGRYALQKYDSITVTLYTFIFATIVLTPFVDIPEMISLFTNFSSIFYAVILGIFSTTMPFLLYTFGLTHLESSKASIIATLEPIVATVIGITLFAEGITLLKVTGIIIVVLGLVIIKNQ